MSFFPSLTPPPPPPSPFLTTANNGTSDTDQPQPYNYNTINNAGLITTTSPSSSSSSSSSPSFTSSIVITSIVISSAIIISASIYILLRFLSRRSPFTSADDVVSPPSSTHPHTNNNNSYYHTALSSLPVFTFGSLNGNLTGGDCAVCLSKFKREETLRLLPLCCHAFHTQCIDAWLLSNQTCPLCRSTVYPTDTDLLNKIISVNENNANNDNNNNIGVSSSNGSSFRVEIGSISSRRRGILHEGIEGEGRRSYSMGSFEYIVDEGYEIPMDYMYMRGTLDVGLVDNKELVTGGASMEVPRPDSLDREVGGSGSGRNNWLREYVDRLSSRAVSFRSSGRFFSGSSRRNDVVVPVGEDLEAINSHAGEDISELFRWISGV